MVSLPHTATDVFRLNRAFLDEHANPEAVRELVVQAPRLQTDLGVLCVNSFLNDESVEELHTLEFHEGDGEDGNYRTDKNIKLVTPMLKFMADVSSMYVEKHPLTDMHMSVKRLRYDTSNPGFNTLVPPHHDWKDGNAVLYNCNIKGPSQTYQVGAEHIEIVENQLTILNGDSTYLPKSHAYGTAVHSVQPSGMYDEQTLREMGRDRFLVFVDGEPTEITMLPPEV